MNTTLSPEVQHVLKRTHQQGKFSDAQYQDIEAAVQSSPTLQSYIETAVKNGDLGYLNLGRNHPGVGGFYNKDSRTVNLTPSAWVEKMEQPTQLDRLTGIIGHETGHAILRESRDKATRTFSHEIYNASFDQFPDHTPAFEKYINHMRRDEALAESFGWNAVHGRVKQEMGGKYNQQDFLDRVALTTHCTEGEPIKPAPGLQLSPEGRIELNAALPNYHANVDAMSRCHFDRDIEPIQGRSGLGMDHNYRNYYGASAASAMAANAARLGASHTLRLDFDRLGLDPGQMEKAGIHLGGQGNILDYHVLRGDRVIGSDNLRDLGIRHDEQSPDLNIQTANQSQTPGMDHHAHPQYTLYRSLQNELPQETSTDRLTQITARSHIAGITPHNLWGIVVTKDEVHVLGEQPGIRADIKLDTLPPTQQESQQHVQAHDMQQQMERAQQQRAQGMSMH